MHAYMDACLLACVCIYLVRFAGPGIFPCVEWVLNLMRVAGYPHNSNTSGLTVVTIAVHGVHNWVRPMITLSLLPGLSELTTERKRPDQHQLGFSISCDQHVCCPQRQGLTVRFL